MHRKSWFVLAAKCEIYYISILPFKNCTFLLLPPSDRQPADLLAHRRPRLQPPFFCPKSSNSRIRKCKIQTFKNPLSKNLHSGKRWCPAVNLAANVKYEHIFLLKVILKPISDLGSFVSHQLQCLAFDYDYSRSVQNYMLSIYLMNLNDRVVSSTICFQLLSQILTYFPQEASTTICFQRFYLTSPAHLPLKVILAKVSSLTWKLRNFKKYFLEHVARCRSL